MTSNGEAQLAGRRQRTPSKALVHMEHCGEEADSVACRPSRRLLLIFNRRPQRRRGLGLFEMSVPWHP
jgi:hypothetical protein